MKERYSTSDSGERTVTFTMWGFKLQSFLIGFPSFCLFCGSFLLAFWRFSVACVAFALGLIGIIVGRILQPRSVTLTPAGIHVARKGFIPWERVVSSELEYHRNDASAKATSAHVPVNRIVLRYLDENGNRRTEYLGLIGFPEHVRACAQAINELHGEGEKELPEAPKEQSLTGSILADWRANIVVGLKQMIETEL